MKLFQRSLVVLTGAILAGCVTSLYKGFINSDNQRVHCYQTSAGVVGSIIASSNFESCVTRHRAAGYIDLEEAGTTGIQSLTADQNAVRVAEIAEDSPAAIAGISRGDLIISIDGQVASEAGQAMRALFGKVQSQVSIVFRSGSNYKTILITRGAP